MPKYEYDVEWKMQFPPSGLQVEQVYGILFDNDDKVLVLDDKGRHNLPGGHPEGNEDWLQTLARECMEEAQVEICRPMYLGYVHVLERGHGSVRAFAQVRFVASVARLLPTTIDPATGKTYDRKFCSPVQTAGLLGWGPHGSMQLSDAENLWKLVNKGGELGDLLAGK